MTSPSVRPHLVMCLVVVGLAAAYLIPRADRGWFPHDEGYLGQSAERVLQGELPHRDFDDLYTGGLAVLHALAFEIFGVELVVLRWVVLAFFLGALAALYAIAAHFAGPLACGIATLLAATWGLPLYFASMASWYNLFFAIFGTLALLRFVKTERKRWLLVAGLWAGASFLVKSVGLYFVAAVLLFLVYHEQLEAEAETESGRREGRGQAGFRVFQAVGLGLFCSVLLLLVSSDVRGEHGHLYLLHFVLPGVALAALLGWNEAASGGGAFGPRLRRILSLALPFAAGLSLPVALFLVPYAVSGSLPELVGGVFIAPLRRLEYSGWAPASLLWGGVPMALLLTLSLLSGTRLGEAGALRWLSRDRRRVDLVLLTMVVATIVWLARNGGEDSTFFGVWESALTTVPLISVFGCLALALGTRRGDLSRLRRRQIFLLLAVCAMVSMVQYPFATGIYFGYVAPLLPALFLAVLSSQKAAPRLVYVGVAVFYALFATRFVEARWQASSQRLESPRAGLRVLPHLARDYDHMVRVVTRESAPGSFIYATPDLPEAYFLTGRRNPTRTLFDFFDADFEDPERRRGRILALLERRAVDVVVVLRRPQFSKPIDPELLAELVERYPHSARSGRFRIRWRNR